MKATGIFKVMAAALLAMSHGVKSYFKSSSKGVGGSNRVSNGRAAFYGVSAPKCHNQKKRWF